MLLPAGCLVSLLVALPLGERPPVRGVALGLYSEDPGYSYRPLLQEIAELGANQVELVINIYQKTGRSTELYPHSRFTASEGVVARAVEDARRLGLESMIFPIVRLEKPAPGEWRGSLRPKDEAAWWRSYERILLRYAHLAARSRAAALAIGSEFGTLDGPDRLERWRSLAQKVRRIFHGKLVYSANWDHYRDVGLWETVDVMGLSAYFELAEKHKTSPAPELELNDRWRVLRQEIESVAARVTKRVLFTEVGYLSQRLAAAWPWREDATEPVDLDEQRRCYAAFVKAWRGARSLDGVFFWNWYGWGGTRSGGYTPRGKPAALEISRWYRDRP